MPETELLYATNNPGKLQEVGEFLGDDWPVESPRDLGLKIEVEESGLTLEENALLKARAYREGAPDDAIVMADDTGLEISGLGGEPGVKVRRWRDGTTEMSDQAIIRYCLQRMKYLSGEARRARFRTVVALILPDGTEQLFDGALEGAIATDEAYALTNLQKGFPFESLFYLPELEKYLGQLQPDDGVPTHRQVAVRKAAGRLSDYNK